MQRLETLAIELHMGREFKSWFSKSPMKVWSSYGTGLGVSLALAVETGTCAYAISASHSVSDTIFITQFGIFHG